MKLQHVSEYRRVLTFNIAKRLRTRLTGLIKPRHERGWRDGVETTPRQKILNVCMRLRLLPWREKSQAHNWGEINIVRDMMSLHVLEVMSQFFYGDVIVRLCVCGHFPFLIVMSM